MLARRPILLAGGAALTAGGLLAWQRRAPLLHHLGLTHSPDYHPPDHRVPTQTGTLQSARVARAVRWKLSLPEKPQAIVFCLHGRGGNEESPFAEQHLPDVATELGLPLAFAGVEAGGDRSYWHPRRDGTDALALLTDELIPLAEKLTGTTRRLLLGWSMGGYGALLAAQTHPDRFAGVAALSPALWLRYEESARGAFDDAADFRRHDVFAGRPRLAHMGVFLACGKGDPFYEHTKRFAAGLSKVETALGPGFHEPPFWRSVAPQALKFLARCLGERG